MKTLKDLRKEIEDIEITYDYDKCYTELLNATIDYQNETQDWRFEELFNEYIDYEIAEEQAKYELENGGLARLSCFLGDCHFGDVMRINAYGNLEDIDIEDLRYLKESILDEIDNSIENKEEN